MVLERSATVLMDSSFHMSADSVGRRRWDNTPPLAFESSGIGARVLVLGIRLQHLQRAAFFRWWKCLVQLGKISGIQHHIQARTIVLHMLQGRRLGYRNHPRPA